MLPRFASLALVAAVAAAAAAAAGGARAWLTTTVPIKVDSGGHTRLIDTHGLTSHVQAPEPGCEIIAVLFTPNEGAPFPKAPQELYMVALTDPLHDVEVKGEGCVNHANGACVDEVYSFRVNYRHLHSNHGRDLGYNWCIPKGWNRECDFQPLNDTCKNIDPGTYDCARCDGANQCNTKLYGRWCQTWEPNHLFGTDAMNNEIRSGFNPSTAQGDCHYAYEVALFSHRPTKCRVEPFKLHTFHGTQMRHQGDVVHYSVVVEGNDADIKPTEKLTFWMRSFPDHCLAYKKWLTETTLPKTATVKNCKSADGATDWFHGITTLYPDTNKDWSSDLGVGHHCAGHKMGAGKCSPKHFLDEMFPVGRCRLFGCGELPPAMATAEDTCFYGDLMLSANFDFDMNITESPQSSCDPSDPESHRFFEVMFTGVAKTAGPLGTTGDFNDEPNYCCNIDGVHQANPLAHEQIDADNSAPGTLQNIPCGIAPDGRQMVFDACNVCGGSGRSCRGALGNGNNAAGSGGSQTASGAARAVVGASLLLVAVAAAAAAALV